MEMVTNIPQLTTELVSSSGPLAMLVEESYKQGMLIQQSAINAAAEWTIRLVQENTPEILVMSDPAKTGKPEFAVFHSPLCRIHQGHSCATLVALLDGQERLAPGNYYVWAKRPDREGTELRFERVE